MAVTDEKLVDHWTTLKAHAQQYRDHFEPRWIRNWEMYRNTRKTPRIRGQASWRANSSLPDAFRIIETMVPHHIRTIFRTDNWFSVESPVSPPETYATLVRSLLLQGWRKADGFKKTIEAVKLGNILGHFVAKVHWDVTLGEREVMDFDHQLDAEGNPIGVRRVRRTVPDVRHNGPQISIPDLMNVWQDPSGKVRWVIEKLDASLSELKENNKQFEGALYKNLSQLQARRSLGLAVTGGQHFNGDRQTIADITEGLSDHMRQDKDHVTLWQCWGWVPSDVKKYEDTQWRLIVIADESVVIRDEKAPTPDHRPPYINTQGIPIPHQLYGDSVLSYTGDLMEQRSNIENMRYDEILMQIYGTHAIHADAQVDGKFFKEPGGYIKIRPPFGGSLSDVFMNVPRNPILNEAYLESSAKERQILDNAGTTEAFQGTFAAGGSHRTKAEFDGTVSLGSARIEMATMWMDETWKKPALEMMFKMYQTRLTTPEMIQLSGEKQVRSEIDLDDLQYDVDIYVDSGLFGSLDQSKFQSLMQLYQMLLANPATEVHLDPRKVATLSAHRLGMTGMDDVLRTPEAVQQIEQQRAQEAQQLAAIEASGAPG